MLGKRIDGARRKNRRCSAKEPTILFKRSADAKRKQSIYSQISLNCYAVGGSNTGPKHSKIIVFPLEFREVFYLLLPVSEDSSGATPQKWEVSEKTLVFPMRLSTLMRTSASL